MDDYRAPTPATLSGARVVNTAEAETLWKSGAAFVDVLPHLPRPANLPAGTVWREKPRFNIPGSIWLPDTGYGEIAAEVETYLRTGLERITGGDRGRSGRLLLPRGLLDVVECRQAGTDDGIRAHCLVSRRHRGLGSRGTAASRSEACAWRWKITSQSSAFGRA